MTTAKYTIVGAQVSLDIQPMNEGQPVDPKLVADLTGFLAVMEKAGIYQQGHVFSRVLATFLEEVDGFLDDQRARQEPDLTEEGDEFVEEHLPPGVKANLRKVGEYFRKK